MIPGIVKRIGHLTVVTGFVLYGIGGCGLRQIGLGLLSEFLTAGDSSSLGSTITSGLDTLLEQLTGATTS